jgi:hypothetical protein
MRALRYDPRHDEMTFRHNWIFVNVGAGIGKRTDLRPTVACDRRPFGG